MKLLSYALIVIGLVWGVLGWLLAGANSKQLGWSEMIGWPLLGPSAVVVGIAILLWR